jgi:cytochrome c-type biogenesis protein CcmF
VPLALASLVRRNRRRYGGYLAHLGIVTLFVGVAASSSFKDVQDVSLSPGQTAKVGGYEFTYVKPIAELHAAPNGRLERIAFGAQLSVRKDGGKPRPLRTSKDYFPSQDTALGPVSRFFDGESTTEVGLDTSLHNDIWAAVAPDTAKLRPRIDEGDRLFDKAADDLTVEQSDEFLALALRGLTDSYAQSPPPARFRLEVNPMVTWIWIGCLIVVLGGFIAAWPNKRGLTRIASARYAAKVGSDVREQETVPA